MSPDCTRRRQLATVANVTIEDFDEEEDAAFLAAVEDDIDHQPDHQSVPLILVDVGLSADSPIATRLIDPGAAINTIIANASTKKAPRREKTLMDSETVIIATCLNPYIRDKWFTTEIDPARHGEVREMLENAYNRYASSLLPTVTPDIDVADGSKEQKTG
ncbi:hypothetical protein B9479_008296 [Cryptococcus floricola]|uniref:Uncharacterized protein n=1 Tax=Cryptococcus floricola TaxID=2591691 RepID=A0A5D3AL83_9TREE|nr:hypothetical protein B9479_008296 [Cryptococcus floricola]